MNNLLIQSTCEPEERLPINEWFRYINRDTLFGQAVVNGLHNNPHETVRMISEAYEDNPVMVRNIIGDKILNQIV